MFPAHPFLRAALMGFSAALILYFNLLSKPVAAQTLVWAEKIGGTPLVCSSEFRPGSITTDHSGNMLLAGNYPCTADLNPGSPVYNLSTTIASAYVQKLNAGGGYVWAKGLGAGGSGFSIKGLAADAADNVYITGTFIGNPDFDPGPAAYTFYSSEYRMYVIKLNSAGAFQWVKIIGGSGGEVSGSSIRIDGANNIYVGGTFSGNIDFNPDTAASAVNMVDAPDRNIFLLKLNAAGNYRWAQGIGGIGLEDNVNIEVDQVGGLYYSAYFSSSFSPDPTGGSSTVFTPTGSRETIISKFDTAGAFMWARQLKTANSSALISPRAMTIDKTGHVSVTGFFAGEVDFDPSAAALPITGLAYPWSVFTMRLDANGNLSWAKTAVMVTDGYAIGCDSVGNVYTVGDYLSDGTDIDPGPGVFDLHNDHPSTVYMGCIFVQCLDSTGTFKWATGTFGTATMEPAAARVTENGFVYHTGIFGGSADFDPGPDSTILVDSNGYSYTYALKLAPPDPAVSVPVATMGETGLINVYPNPTSGTVSVQSTAAILQLSIIDIMGREVYRATPNAQVATVSLAIPGTYIMQVVTANGATTHRVQVLE